MEPLLSFLAAFITAIVIVGYSIPIIIKVSVVKRLFDAPDGDRKIHKNLTPNLGGIAIFAGTIIAYLLWGVQFEMAREVRYFLSGIMLIFFIGIKDDLISVPPLKKLSIQILAGILLILGDIRIHSLYQIFGVGQLPYWVSVALTLFVIIVIINAFNLIDGIDGLAAGLAFVMSGFYGSWFYMTGHNALAVLAASLAGACLAFLRFNFSKRRSLKTFMGDTGSMTIGLIISLLSLEFIYFGNIVTDFQIKNAPVIAIGVLIVPLFDTISVFAIRISQRRSPLSADKNHLHHRLLALGLNHITTAILMYLLTVVFIVYSLLLRNLNPTSHFLILFFTGLIVLHFFPKVLGLFLKKTIANPTLTTPK